MPRSGRLRNFIRHCGISGVEKLSYVPPYLILIIEIILLIHAFYLEELFVMILTSALLVISVIEIILVSGEMHESYQQSYFDKILTIKLDDFITDSKEINVKKIVENFINQYPEYSAHRSEIYHTSCQILETHKREKNEKDLDAALKKFIKAKLKSNVDEIVEEFVKKYPKFKSNKSKIYEKTCKIKSELE